MSPTSGTVLASTKSCLVKANDASLPRSGPNSSTFTTWSPLVIKQFNLTGLRYIHRIG